jgi:ABC-type transporter Mla subunit MlaD
MTDLIKRLRLQSEHIPVRTLFDDAADRIEELVKENKELTLQLLAVHGQAADALDRLAKAVERLKTMADYNKYVIAPFLAELEKKE